MLCGKRLTYPTISMDATGVSYSPVVAFSATHLMYNTLPAGFAPFPNISVSGATTLVHLEYRNKIYTLQLGANLLSSTDGRIALELGTSLPIVNNPMVDHNQVHPDYTVGRWMESPCSAEFASIWQGPDLQCPGPGGA